MDKEKIASIKNFKITEEARDMSKDLFEILRQENNISQNDVVTAMFQIIYLPDEDFLALKELSLKSIEKELNNTNNQAMLAQALLDY